MQRLRTLHLFAGAGGGILADLLLGHQPVCAVEINEYCQRVLSARQEDGYLPWFPIFADVKEFNGRPWRGIVDVISGGFPCQDISCAGKGAGIEEGERSGLWREFARIIREVRPRYVYVENSPMLTVRGLGIVLGDLAALGYDAEWGVLGASDVGGCHRRERIWIFAYYPDKIGRENSLFQSKVTLSTKTPRREFERTIDATIPSLGDSDKLGDHDDVAGWLERFEAIGNGQVPLVAAVAWRMLINRMEDTCQI